MIIQTVGCFSFSVIPPYNISILYRFFPLALVCSPFPIFLLVHSFTFIMSVLCHLISRLKRFSLQAYSFVMWKHSLPFIFKLLEWKYITMIFSILWSQWIDMIHFFSLFCLRTLHITYYGYFGEEKYFFFWKRRCRRIQFGFFNIDFNLVLLIH